MSISQNINLNFEKSKIIKHESGLTIILDFMPKYNYCYVMLGTKYGSINNSFKINEKDEFYNIPSGTAHFLEHKMFESESGVDAFERYAKVGAEANAFTGFTYTCYLFSCFGQLKEPLEILLEFVTHPYFTSENVRKERGIIKQEIKMYEDDPNWKCYFNILKGLYHNIPVHNDIAGTEATICEITPEILYKCYYTFYNLNNMVLSIAGNFSEKEVIEVIDKMLVKTPSVNIINKKYDEPQCAVISETVCELPISLPVLGIGYKHKPGIDDRNNFILNIKYSLINEIIIGETSDLYDRLYNNRLINNSVFSEVMSGPGYLSSIFILETRNPQLVKDEFVKEIERLKISGFSNNEFISIKKSFYGQYIMEMDSPATVARNNMDGYIEGLNYNEWQEIINNITKDELEIILRNDYKIESSTMSVVMPLKS